MIALLNWMLWSMTNVKEQLCKLGSKKLYKFGATVLSMTSQKTVYSVFVKGGTIFQKSFKPSNLSLLSIEGYQKNLEF